MTHKYEHCVNINTRTFLNYKKNQCMNYNYPYCNTNGLIIYDINKYTHKHNHHQQVMLFDGPNRIIEPFSIILFYKNNLKVSLFLHFYIYIHTNSIHSHLIKLHLLESFHTRSQKECVFESHR